MKTSKREPEVSRAYAYWLVVKENPDIKLGELASKLGKKSCDISDAISKMVRRGQLEAAGKKGDWRYQAVDSNPPRPYGYGSYVTDDDFKVEFEWLEPSVGNPVFDECRQYSGNYLLTKLVREVRA